MTPLFKKLNYKEHKEIVVVNAPESFRVELDLMRQETTVVTNLHQVAEINFALLFVIKREEINRLIEKLSSKFSDDVVLWFAYPKGTSGNYTCDFNRDTGWDKVQTLGFEGVRMVALDQDWSALRFRRSQYINKRK